MSVVGRARNMLRQPTAEWATIEGEEVEPLQLFSGYVARVAILPAAAGFLSMMLFSHSGVRIGFGTALGNALAQYVSSIAMVYVIAFIADVLAAGFEGHQNMDQALKLAAYAMTPAWIAGIFVIVPGIGWLLTVLGSLYSLYVLFLGVTVLMRVPAQKAVTYAVAIAALAIAVNFMLAMINVKLFGVGAGGIFNGVSL